MNRRVRAAVWAMAAMASPAWGQYLGPSPYARRADSPFAGPGFSFFRLENLEDGVLNATGLGASVGIVLGSGINTDSVDGDDGVIDGLGRDGRSWYIGSADTVTFTFSPVAIGALPTRAGVVWTDVGATTLLPFGTASVTFEARDGGGVSLGVHGPFVLGDGSVAGGTGEDRFLGIIHEAGISSITIRTEGSSDWEVDHIQYGIRGSCRPDLTASATPGAAGYGSPDGIVDNEDFFYYLAQFNAGNLAVADLTATAIPGSAGYGSPNGVLNNDDFFYYLAVFAIGC